MKHFLNTQDWSRPELDALLAQAVISLGHSLRLKIVAEGVETAEQLDFLRHHGCDEVQGYLIACPAPAEELAGILALGSIQLAARP